MAKGTKRADQRVRGHARHPRRVRPISGLASDRIAAVIPAYKAASTIEGTLRALQASLPTPPGDIVVVCSPGDDTASRARRFAGVEVIESPLRLSAGAARNRGAAAAMAKGCDALVFVDADCAVGPDTLSRLRKALAGSSAVAVAASVVASDSRLLSRLRHAVEFKEFDGSASSREVGFAPTATMLCRTEAFTSVGGFADLWPGEDLVFCSSLVGQGTLLFEAQAVSVHSHPPGWVQALRHQYRLGRTSALARRSVAMPGSALAASAWSAPALIVGRTVRAVSWFARHKPGELAWLIAVLPLYVGFVTVWAAGFASGCGRPLREQPAAGTPTAEIASAGTRAA